MADRVKLPLTQVEYLQAPTGGWSPDVPAWELPLNEAVLLENFQIKAGKIRVRPVYRVTCDLTSANVALAGWVPYGNGASLLTRRVFTSGYGIEPQNIHRVGTSLPASPTIPVEDAFYNIVGSAVTKVTFSAAHGQAPGYRSVDFNGGKYALTYAGSATLAYNDGVTSWRHNVVALNNTADPAILTGAPQGGFDIYGWLSRLWVLGGRAPTNGSTPVGSTTALFYSNPIQILTGASTDWEDPVSGLYNLIDIDGEHTNPGVALASVPAGLIILRQNSVFILRGTDPTSYTIRPVSKQAGCLDARSVVEMDSKVYFMSDQGFMVTDGTQVQNVSGSLQDELYRQIAWWTLNVHAGAGSWWTCAPLSDGKIMMTAGNYSTGNYTMDGAFSAVFDPASGSWVKMSTAVNPTNTTGFVGPLLTEYGALQSLGNTQQLTIEDAYAGYTTSGPSSLHDVSTPSGTFVPITATWQTRSANLALGGRLTSHLKRVALDHANSTGGPTANLTLQLVDRLAPIDGIHNTFTTKTIAVSLDSADPRQTLQVDDQHEVADLGINVTLTGTATGSTVSLRSEVHGIFIEYQPSMNMHATV